MHPVNLTNASNIPQLTGNGGLPRARVGTRERVTTGCLRQFCLQGY